MPTRLPTSTLRTATLPVGRARWLLALLVPLALACGGGPAEAPAAAAPEPVVVGDEDLVVVARESLAAGPRVSGTLEAATKAVIRAEAAGSVEEVMVELGQTVEKGALLARIEARTARDALGSASAGVESAASDLSVAERELERATRLVEAGALAARDRELAQSQVVSARARLKDAESRRVGAAEQVEGATARAPMTGVVSERAVGAGDIVSPGAPMFTIIDPTSLRLDGAVPADAIGQLTVGMAVRFSVQGHPGRTFDGTLASIAPAVDATTRQIPVLVTLPNPEGALVAGLFADGRVATEVRDGIVVPSDALVTIGGVQSVMRVRDGKAERVAIEVGIRDEDAERVELRAGIDPGDIVLVGAARDIAPGTPVEVRKAEVAPPATTDATPAGEER
jgi:membrane fusion protein (multidrug efflux system)